MKRRRDTKTNPFFYEVVIRLEKTKKPLWKRVAEILRRPRRKRVEVNVGEIGRKAREDIVVVPGKVLGYGEIGKPLTVIAFSFTESAKKKIESAGGKALTFLELETLPERGQVIV